MEIVNIYSLSISFERLPRKSPGEYPTPSPPFRTPTTILLRRAQKRQMTLGHTAPFGCNRRCAVRVQQALRNNRTQRWRSRAFSTGRSPTLRRPSGCRSRLNEELRLPESFIAVQIRRGDKVAGNRKAMGGTVGVGGGGRVGGGGLAGVLAIMVVRVRYWWGGGSASKAECDMFDGPRYLESLGTNTFMLKSHRMTLKTRNVYWPIP